MDDTISRQAAIDTVAEYEKQLCEILGDENELVETVKILKHRLIALPSAQQDNSCDGCRYENADDGVLVPCGFCKRSHPDNYERRTDE